MNEIQHRKIVIEFDVWAPFKREAEKDVDDLINLKKEKKLFRNCGNVVISFPEEI